MRKIALLLLILAATLSCNKEKRFSNRLMFGESWDLSVLTVNGETLPYSGTWTVTKNVEIYDSVPTMLWNANNQSATFQWQFQDKGKTFEIAYKDPTCVNCTTPPDELDFQTYFLSGKYDVVVHKKDKMRFVSSNTVGFPGKRVEINVDRKN